jgi:DNA-binding CsgD family transcriptional regulator/tetratricopeptide (TPR) repeat protein
MLELSSDGLYETRFASMRDWGRCALHTARPLGDRRLIASAAALVALACACGGDVEEAHASCDEAASVLDGMPDDELATCIGPATDALAAAELLLDRLADAAAHSERALAVARATGQGHVLPVLFWAGLIRTARGRLGEAADVLDTAVEIARVSRHAAGAGWNLFARSLAATAAGDVDTALATADESARALRTLDMRFPAAGAGLARAAALLDAADPTGAPRARCSRPRVATSWGALPAAWRVAALELETRCRLARGRREEAAEIAARTQVAADALGTPLARAHAHRAAAAVALEAGDQRFAAERAPGLRGDGRGGRSRRRGGRSRGSSPAGRWPGRAIRVARRAELERAAATFDACAAPCRRDAAERELGRLRHRRHRRTGRGRRGGDGVATLTERELQVARLVVDRRTNAEIAATLFLIPKTVESRIRNPFHKLDVSSRVEVARVVERAARADRQSVVSGGVTPS